MAEALKWTTAPSGYYHVAKVDGRRYVIGDRTNGMVVTIDGDSREVVAENLDAAKAIAQSWEEDEEGRDR